MGKEDCNQNSMKLEWEWTDTQQSRTVRCKQISVHIRTVKGGILIRWRIEGFL